MSSLFFVRGPFAVVRFIVAFIIDSIDGAALMIRAWPHVSKKVFKGVKPAVANCYTASAVVLVSSGFRLVATRFHTKPSSVLGCFAAFIFIPRATVFCSNFFKDATARFRKTVNERILLNDFYIAALAATDPLASITFFTFFVFCKPDYCKAPVLLTKKREVFHTGYYKPVCFGMSMV